MSHEGPVYTNSRYSNSSSSERGSTSRPTLDYFGPTNNIANINNSFSNMKVFGRVVQSQSVSLNSGAAYLSQPPTPSISDTNASHLSQYRQMSGSSTSGFYNSNIHQILQSPGNSNNHTNLAHFPPRHNSTSGYSYYSQVDTVGNLNGVMPPTPPHRNLSVADRSSVLGFSDCYGNSGSAGWPSQPSPPIVAAGPLFPMSKANTSSSTSGSVPLFFSDLPNTNSSTEANRSKPLLSNEPSINKYAYRNSDSTGSVTDENNNGNTKKPVLDATEMSRIVRQSGLSQNAHNPYLKRGSEDDGVTMDMLSTSHSKQGSGSTPIRVSGGPSGEVRLSDEGKERTSAEGSSPPVQQPVVEEEDMQANSTLGFIEEGGQVIGSSPVVKSISVNSVSGGGGTIQGPENLPITHQTLAFVSNEAVDPTKESKILLTEDSHDSKVRVGEGCGDSLRRRRSSNTGMDNILLRSTEADGSSKEHEGDDQTKNGHPDEEKNVPPSEDQSGLESDGEASTTNTTNTFVTGSEYSDRPSSAFSDVDSEMRGETEGTSADMRLPSILDTNSSKVVSPPSHTPRKSRQSVVLIRDRKDSLDVRGASKSNSEAMSSGNGSGTFYSEMGNSRRRTALPQQLSHTLLPAEDGKDSLENTARPLSSSTKKSKRLGSVSTETNKASKASEIKRTEDADTATVESRSLVTPKEKPKKKKAVKESVAKQPEPSLPAKPKKKNSVPPTKAKSPGTKKRSVSTKKRKSSATPTGEQQVDSRGSSPNRGSKGSAEIPFSLTSPGRSKSTDSVRFSINEEAVPSPGEADKANKGKVIRPIGTRRESVLRKRASSVNSSRAGSFFSVSSSRNSSLSRSGSASSSKRGSHMLASLDNITQRCLDSVPYQSFKEKDVWKSAKKYRKLVSTELLKWHMHGYQFILKEEAEAFKRLTESVIQPPLRSALEREVTRLARERERIAKSSEFSLKSEQRKLETLVAQCHELQSTLVAHAEDCCKREPYFIRQLKESNAQNLITNNNAQRLERHFSDLSQLLKEREHAPDNANIHKEMTNTISVTQNLLELLSLKEDYYKDMAEGQRKLLSEGAARQVVADTFLVETVLKEQNYTRYKVSQEEGMLKKVQGSMEELERNYVLNLERLMELCNTHLSNHHKDTDKQKLTLPEIREDILEEFKTGNDKLMALKSSILREAQTAFIELWQKTSESNLETCSLNQGNLSQCLCCGLSPQYTTTLQDECGTEDYQRIIHHLALLDPTQNIPFILSELDHIERHHLHAADTAHHGRREVTDTKPQEGPNMLESDTRKPFFDKERPPPQSVQRLMQEETARRADGMQQNSTNGPYNPSVNNNNSVFFSSSLFANNSKVSVDLNNNKVFVPNPPRYFSAPQTRSANNNNSNSSNSEATPASSSTRGGRRQYTLLSQMAEEEKKYKETNRNRLLNKMMLNTVVVGEDDDDVYNTYYPVHAAGEELPKNDTAFRKTGSVAPPVPPRRLYINSVMEQNSHSAEEVLASNGRNAAVATFPPLRVSSMQQD